MLTLRKIEQDELTLLYRHMKRDFPSMERMPGFMLKGGVYRGHLHAYYLVDGMRQEAGYAVCILPEGRNFVHVHYFAVFPENRSKGYGGKFLKLLVDQFPERTMILEVENPETAPNARDYRMRNKRIAFYRRAGFHIQPTFRLRLFGIEMLCMANTTEKIADPKQLWRSCYAPILPMRIMERFVKIYDAVASPHGPVRIKPGKYRHFKGGEYEMLFMAKHSESLEPMVVYKALYGEGDCWVRPAAMWNETVEVDGKRVKRFTYIGG